MPHTSEVSSPRPGSGAGPEPALDAGLAQWAREYADDLRRFLAKRHLIESDIKDVCQEVYLRLLRFERSAVVQNPQAYLFRVAANVAHDFKLRRARWTSLEDEMIEELRGDSTPEQAATAADRSRHLMRVVTALPPLPRAALMLKYRDGLSYAQISDKLAVSHRAVKRAVARGLALMREALQKEI